MDTKQKQAIESLMRVQAFLARHPAPPPFDYAAPKAELDSVIDELGTQALAQASGRRGAAGETQRLKRLVLVLRMHHLRPIVVIARASMRSKPGIQAALRTPRINMPVTKLLQEARAIRNVAKEYEPLFVERGRPSDFLAQLDAAIDAVKVSVSTRSQQLATSIGANAGISQEISRGKKAVAMLDSVVRVAFEQNDAVLLAWDVTKRVPAPASSQADDETAGSEPQAAA